MPPPPCDGLLSPSSLLAVLRAESGGVREDDSERGWCGVGLPVIGFSQCEAEEEEGRADGCRDEGYGSLELARLKEEVAEEEEEEEEGLGLKPKPNLITCASCKHHTTHNT